MIVARLCRVVQIALHIHGRLGQYVLRGGENILKKCLGNNAQRDFAIDATEGEVVDLVAEGRNIATLGRVHLDSEYVVAARVQDGPRSQFEAKRRVAALVFSELVAIQVDGRGSHHAFEIDKNALAHGRLGQLEVATIGRDKCVVVLAEAVPRQLDIGVGNYDALKT